MTQIFTEEGRVIPVTVVETGKNIVIRNKTVDTDGYCAVQLGFGDIKENKVNKPDMGQFKKAEVKPVKFIREVRLAAESEYKIGDVIGVDIFAAGELVDVIGTSKGKGFQLRARPHGSRLQISPRTRLDRRNALRPWRSCHQRQKTSRSHGRHSHDDSAVDDC